MSSITYQVTVNEYVIVWKLNDKPHRVDGPAVEFADGRKCWYLNGDEVSEEQHRAQTQPAVELTIAEIEKLLGKRIKVVK